MKCMQRSHAEEPQETQAFGLADFIPPGGESQSFLLGWDSVFGDRE